MSKLFSRQSALGVGSAAAAVMGLELAALDDTRVRQKNC